MDVFVKGNLIVNEATGSITPVQHIRGIDVYGVTATVKLAGANPSLIEMDKEKNSAEIIEELTDAYLVAQQNYERKNYPVRESKPMGSKLSKSEEA